MDNVQDSSKVCAALVAAVGELKNPTFDSVNPHFGSRFVRLSTMLEQVREVFSRHGLAILQPASSPERNVVQVQTVIIHASGQRLEFPALAMGLPEKAQAIAVGSCISYARRYSLQSAIGLAGDEDDDGEADRVAKGGSTAQAVPQPRTAPPAAPRAREGDSTPKPPKAATAAPAARNALPTFGGDTRDVIGKVTYLKVSEGQGRNGKPYRKARVGVKPSDTALNGDEVLYSSTFDQTLIGLMESAKESGEEVRVGLRAGQYGDDLVDASYVSRQSAEVTDDIPF